MEPRPAPPPAGSGREGWQGGSRLSRPRWSPSQAGRPAQRSVERGMAPGAWPRRRDRVSAAECPWLGQTRRQADRSRPSRAPEEAEAARSTDRPISRPGPPGRSAADKRSSGGRATGSLAWQSRATEEESQEQPARIDLDSFSSRSSAISTPEKLGLARGAHDAACGKAARLASELLLSRPPDLADEIESRLLLPKALV